MNEFIVLGLSHKTAPIEVREKFNISKLDQRENLSRLAKQDGIQSGMVLSTCNRVEVYVSGESAEILLKAATTFFQSLYPIKKEEENLFYKKQNREAVKHLFRVASSLDSMVVGEPQVLGQVKEAYFAASAFDLTDTFMEQLLQKTFSVAKKVRSETSISEHAVSISHAAVALGVKIFESLKDKTVLVLGAGEMAELTAKNLSKHSLKEIFFANRSYEHSVELAKEFRGIPIPMDDFHHYLGQSDIVISSTAAPHFLVTQDHVKGLISERRGEPLFLIDISVPRNVDPAINQYENVYLFNIDDLQQVVENNLKVREGEALKAEKIVENEANQFFLSLEKRNTAPTIQLLQKKYENLRLVEMKRLLGRLSSLTNQDVVEINRFSETLVRKILNDPIIFVNEIDPELGSEEKITWISKIFSLKKIQELS